jgi:hypothetical protein
MGRTYLLYKPSIIDEITNIMFKEDTDSEVRQNCLGIIQKFTLRSEPQKKLIELDVIRWIVSMFVIVIYFNSGYGFTDRVFVRIWISSFDEFITQV